MSAGYEAARAEETIYIKANGLANMKNAPMLDAFLRNEIIDGAKDVFIDLSACTGMDSTFMGTLVGFAGDLSEKEGRLHIVNPGVANEKLLGMLGVTAVVPIVNTAMPTGIEFEPLECSAGQSQAERMSVIKHAHEKLVSLNDENKAKFSAFLQALNADLEK